MKIVQKSKEKIGIILLIVAFSFRGIILFKLRLLFL